MSGAEVGNKAASDATALLNMHLEAKWNSPIRQTTQGKAPESQRRSSPISFQIKIINVLKSEKSLTLLEAEKISTK